MFVTAGLTVAVRKLIRRNVHSVGELELLILLHAERDRSWGVAEICDALGCPPSWAEAQLAAMDDGGLVESAGDQWRFAPSNQELADATAALQEAYRLQSREVVRYVFATPGRDLKAFSDAFLVRREDR